LAQRCQDARKSAPEQLNHRDRREPKETEAVGQAGVITLRVRAVLSQVPLLAFFALFVVRAGNLIGILQAKARKLLGTLDRA
jgi:hypothetical protein